MSQKDTSRIDDLGGQFLVVGSLYDEVFGGVGIAQAHHLLVIMHQDDLAVRQGLLGNLTTGQHGQLGLHLGLHPGYHLLAGGDEQHLAIYPVLSLREEVGSHEAGIAPGIGQHSHLAGTCGHVDGHVVERHVLLGTHHVLVARTENLIDLGDGLRTVGHGTDGLYATYLIYSIDTSHTRSHEDGRIHAPVLAGRGAEHDVAATGYLGRNGQHEHGAEQRCRAAGDVESHLLYGDALLPAGHTRLHLYPLAREPLCGMKGVNVAVGMEYGLLERLVHLVLCGLHLGLADLQLMQRHVVEACLIFTHGLITTLLDVVENCLHCGVQRTRFLGRSFQQF